MQTVRDSSDILIDTSHLSPWALKSQLVGRFASEDARVFRLHHVLPFRRGVPREADLVFDVRFLRNPHYIEDSAR